MERPALASSIGLDDVVSLLQATLDEEGSADQKLTGISETLVEAAPR